MSTSKAAPGAPADTDRINEANKAARITDTTFRTKMTFTPSGRSYTTIGGFVALTRSRIGIALATDSGVVVFPLGAAIRAPDHLGVSNDPCIYNHMRSLCLRRGRDSHPTHNRDLGEGEM